MIDYADTITNMKQNVDGHQLFRSIFASPAASNSLPSEILSYGLNAGAGATAAMMDAPSASFSNDCANRK